MLSKEIGETDTDVEETEDTDTSANTVTNTVTHEDPNVNQFKLKLEDPFVHTFNGWATFSFPSKNISFWAKNISTTLGLDWTNCSIRTDVIDYPNRDNKHTSPAISYYTCSTSITSENAGNYLYIPSNVDWRAYLVEVNDNAWFDFARNTMIQD